MSLQKFFPSLIFFFVTNYIYTVNPIFNFGTFDNRRHRYDVYQLIPLVLRRLLYSNTVYRIHCFIHFWSSFPLLKKKTVAQNHYCSSALNKAIILGEHLTASDILTCSNGAQLVLEFERKKVF